MTIKNAIKICFGKQKIKFPTTLYKKKISFCLCCYQSNEMQTNMVTHLDLHFHSTFITANKFFFLLSKLNRILEHLPFVTMTFFYWWNTSSTLYVNAKCVIIIFNLYRKLANHLCGVGLLLFFFVIIILIKPKFHSHFILIERWWESECWSKWKKKTKKKQNFLCNERWWS